MKIYNTDGSIETINLKGNGTKVTDIWDNIEILDNIHIPSMKKTYPVFEKSEYALKLHDSSMSLNDFWIMTKNFGYDVELIKAD